MKATEHKDTGEKMHVFELSFLIAPTVAEENLTNEVSAIHSIIEKSGGEIISEEFPQMRDLSYGISKVVETKKSTFDEAYFGWVKFDVTVSTMKEIEESVKKNNNIIRHLLIKTVRENTMYTPRFASNGSDKTDEVAVEEGDSTVVSADDKKPVSQEEMDKSIDALVIS